MPQLAPEFYLSQVVWLAISFVILYLLMAKVALPRIGEVLQTRYDRISTDLERAEGFRREAGAILAEYEAAIARARGEAEAVAAAGAEAARNAAQARLAEVEARLAAEGDAAEKRIGQARQAAMAELQELAIGVAQATTARLLGASPGEAEVRAAVRAEMAERARV